MWHINVGPFSSRQIYVVHLYSMKKWCSDLLIRTLRILPSLAQQSSAINPNYGAPIYSGDEYKLPLLLNMHSLFQCEQGYITPS